MKRLSLDLVLAAALATAPFLLGAPRIEALRMLILALVYAVIRLAAPRIRRTSDLAFGATLLALHHLEAFSVVESWSGYFHPTNPAGTAPLDLGSRAKNARASAHTYVRTLRAAFRRRPTFFAFYVGRGDSRFRAENLRLHRELAAAGVPHLFRLYPGAHAQTVWGAHAVAWLRLALAHLEPAKS